MWKSSNFKFKVLCKLKNEGIVCLLCFYHSVYINISKQQVPGFICHLFRIRQQKIVIQTRAKFTLCWLHRDNIRSVAVQLYGLLADLVLTGSISVSASNKFLLRSKKVYHTSKKATEALKVKKWRVISSPVLSATCFHCERHSFLQRVWTIATATAHAHAHRRTVSILFHLKKNYGTKLVVCCNSNHLASNYVMTFLDAFCNYSKWWLYLQHLDCYSVQKNKKTSTK